MGYPSSTQGYFFLVTNDKQSSENWGSSISLSNVNLLGSDYTYITSLTTVSREWHDTFRWTCCFRNSGSSYMYGIHYSSSGYVYRGFAVINGSKKTASDYILYFGSNISGLGTWLGTFATVGIFWRSPTCVNTATAGDQLITAVYPSYQGTVYYGISTSNTTQPTSWFDNDTYSAIIAPKVSQQTMYYIWCKCNASSGYTSAAPYVAATVAVDPAPAPTYTAPTWASNLVYTGGNLQVFSDPGTVSGGTMYYGLGSGTATEPTTWKDNYADVVVQSAGEYFLWYKITGDSYHTDVAPQYLHRVEVAKADQTFNFTSPVDVKVGSQASQSPTGNWQGSWTVTVIDQTVASSTIVGSTLYVSGLAVGTTRIDITCSGNANYNSRTVSIYANVTANVAQVFINGQYYNVYYSDSIQQLHPVVEIAQY